MKVNSLESSKECSSIESKFYLKCHSERVVVSTLNNKSENRIIKVISITKLLYAQINISICTPIISSHLFIILLKVCFI